MKVIPFSPEPESFEIASIFADVCQKKSGERKFGIFKSTPEEIEFISKLYLPFYGHIIENETLLLCALFFKRGIKNFIIRRTEIDSIINQASQNVITPEDLSKIEKYMGAIGFFGRLTGKKKENYIEHVIRGIYPNDYPNSLCDEFSFITKTHLISDMNIEGIVLKPMLDENKLNASFKEILELLSKVYSDIKYLSEISQKIINIVTIRVQELNKEKDSVNNYYKPIYLEKLKRAKEVIEYIEDELMHEISRLEEEFENKISELSRHYPPLYKAITNPLSVSDSSLFGTISAYYDVFKLIKGIMNREPEYNNVAMDLKFKIRAARSIANSLEDKKFSDTIRSVCEYIENELNKILRFGTNKIKEEWSKVEAVKEAWDEEISSLDKEINKLVDGNEKVSKQINKIIDGKKEVVDEIINNTMLNDVKIEGWCYLTFYIASLLKKDKRRFLIYSPAIKKTKKGLSLKGYVFPFDSVSYGIKKLGEDILGALNKDEKVRNEVITEGRKYNLLSRSEIKGQVKSILHQLKNEGWMNDKKLSEVLKELD